MALWNDSATHWIGALWWPSFCSSAPLVTFHWRDLPSSPPAHSVWPSGAKRTALGVDTVGSVSVCCSPKPTDPQTRTVWSQLAAASRRPFGDQVTEGTRSVGSSSVFTSEPSLTFQTRTVSSQPPVAT